MTSFRSFRHIEILPNFRPYLGPRIYIQSSSRATATSSWMCQLTWNHWISIFGSVTRLPKMSMEQLLSRLLSLITLSGMLHRLDNLYYFDHRNVNPPLAVMRPSIVKCSDARVVNSRSSSPVSPCKREARMLAGKSSSRSNIALVSFMPWYSI